MPERTVDVAIIGAGTAGLSAYRAAAQAGAKVLLIEGFQYGTTCARVGCMPSKLLIAAADRAHEMHSSAIFGVHAEGVHIDGQAVMRRLRAERDRFVGFVVDSSESIPASDRVMA
ncbi:MAG: FAD-dependent oxidoreductase, partial [Natronospirillum sp.]